jgi:hypothetical protein
MSPFRRWDWAGWFWRYRPGTSTWIVSHGKNGSPTSGSNQASNSLQILFHFNRCKTALNYLFAKDQTHYYSIFSGIGIVVGAPGDCLETMLFVKRLRGLIAAPDFKERHLDADPFGRFYDAPQQGAADAPAPVLVADRDVVDVQLTR